jgi:hypothetical protein
MKTSYIGLQGDSSYYIWITKWFSYFFSKDNILHVTNVFYPIGIDISAGWEGSILFIIGGIFNHFFSEAVSYNLLILTPFLLNWISIYFVFFKASSRLFLSGLFATFFSLSAFFIVRSFGHPSYLYFFHIPLLFYFFQPEKLERLSYKRSFLIALLFGLISITSWYYFTFSLIISAIFITFYFLQNKQQLKIQRKEFLFLVTISLMFVLALNLPMFKAFTVGSKYFYPYPFKMNNTELNKELSLHLSDYIKPSSNNTLFTNYQFSNSGIEKTIYPGTIFFILFFISVYFIIRKRLLHSYLPYFTIIIIFSIISLGYNSYLPIYRLLNSLPILSTLHSPARFSIIVIFSGWFIMAKTSKQYEKYTMITIFILIFGVFQIFETSKYIIPTQNFSDLYILKSLKNENESPILELPVKFNSSERLLIPSLTDRPVFSGYPQHTTYSPQLEYVIKNNVFNALNEQNSNPKDITPNLSSSEILSYLHNKYNVTDIVVNKQLPLTDISKEIISKSKLIQENDQYAIYNFDKNLSNQQSIKFITSLGIGSIIGGKRSLAEKSTLDVMNTYNKPIKIRINLDLKPLSPNIKYFINGNEENSIDLEVKPGISSIEIRSSSNCSLYGQDCITGFLSNISYELL